MNAERILIIGGGASGVLLAAHLLRRGPPSLTVTLVERRGTMGAGIAYSTDEPDHLLNTRASGMSAFDEDPEHFWRWLQESGHGAELDCADPFCFVPRRLYRTYLHEILETFRPAEKNSRLRLVEGECVALRQLKGGVAAELADGRTEIAGIAVLATGHAEPEREPGSRFSGPWLRPQELGFAPEDEVLILGTGLSMVDNVVLLRRIGHRGRITAVSRKGLLPQVHAPSSPHKLDPADIPFGTSLTYLLQWLRRTAEWMQSRDEDWRDLIDALRPHAQGLWQAMSLDQRRRFLRHARSLWEVHRHRMAPQAARAVREAIDGGQLAILRGRVVETSEQRNRVVTIIRKPGGNLQHIAADRVIDCTGILRDPVGSGGHFVGHLIRMAQARLDVLGIGIEVDERGAVVGADGKCSERLFAVGPVTRARFWEITAIPDIRVQCDALARFLVEQSAHRAG